MTVNIPVPPSARGSFLKAAGNGLLALTGSSFAVAFGYVANGMQDTPSRVACGVFSAYSLITAVKCGIDAYRASRPK